MSLNEQLLQLQADAFCLWLRFHNYHWNVKGLQFAQLHEYTEKAYDNMAEIFDDAAEKLLMKKQKANVCASAMAQMCKLPCLKESDFTAKELLEHVKADYLYLKESFLAINKSAEDESDYPTQAWAQEHVASLEKELWFIDNMLA